MERPRRPRLPRARHTQPLLIRARQRPELFAEFYAQNHEQVLGFFARRVFDPEAAFDLMAETFAAAFASLASFRGDSEAASLAWLWAIARHQLYGWYRRGVVERRALAELGIESTPLGPTEFERIEELAALDRIKDDIRDALETLGTDQRTAVAMRVIDELPYPLIARDQGISEQAARARVSRGLRELNRLLNATPTTEAVTGA